MDVRVRDAPDGRTRLLVRERVAFESALTKMLMAPFGLVSFVMTRGMLHGIKSRAEARRARSRPLRPDLQPGRAPEPQSPWSLDRAHR